MLQSIHFLRFLPFTAILFCVHIGSAGINKLQPENTPGSAQAINARNMLLKVFKAEIGVRESSNNNDGLNVEQYLHYVDLRAGSAWCAAFVCWSLGKSRLANPRSGWSPALFPPARLTWKRNRSVTLQLKAGGTAVQTGDVFGIYFEDKKRIAHCGFVERCERSWIITIEGNTNTQGGREGDGVYRKRRLLSSVYEIADWVDRPVNGG